MDTNLGLEPKSQSYHLWALPFELVGIILGLSYQGSGILVGFVQDLTRYYSRVLARRTETVG